MSDGLNFNADFSQLVDELLRATKAFDGYDVKAQQVTDIVSKLAAGSDLLTTSLNAVSPAGERIAISFRQMDEAMAATSLQTGAVAGGFELINKSIKKFNDQDIGKQKAADLKALADLAVESATQGKGSNTPNILINQISQQIAAVQAAALASKAPVDDLFNLIGKSQGELAGATGELRIFANALFNLGQTAQQTRAADLSNVVTAKFQAVTPTTIDAKQQAELTAATRAIGDAAAKAGLDEQGLNNILSQSADQLSKVAGTFHEVAQAVIDYRSQLIKLNEDQVSASDSQERLKKAAAATSFAKQTFFGAGELVGTNDEVAKQTFALAAFQREAAKTSLSQQQLAQVTEDFRNGIAREEVALAGLNRALIQLQASQRNAGAVQAQAVTQNEKQIAILNRATVAAQAIAQIQVNFPVPPNATVQSIDAYAAALARLQAQVANSNLSAAQVATIFQSSLKGTGDVFGGEAGKIQSATNSVVNSFNAMSASAKGFKGPLSETESAVTAFFSRVGSQITTILINQLFNAFKQGIEEARQFQQTLIESAAITQQVGGSYDQFRLQVLALSNQFGLAREQVAEGVFQTLKHDIGDTAQAAQFAAEAAQFAVVTKASFIDAVNLGTASLNSFNLSVDNSHLVFATLFEAIKSGRLSTQELSTTLGTLGVLASQVGVSLEETTAALSALTHSGVNAANSQTFLRNLFKELVSPTKAMQEVLDTYGFATGKAAIETLGLTGFLQLLQTSAGGNISKMGDLIVNLRSLQAALGLTGDKFNVFIRQLDKTKDATTDYQKAVDVTFKSNVQLFTEFREQIINKTKGISDTLIELSGDIIRAFSSSGTAVNVLQNIIVSFSVAAFIASIGTVITTLQVLTKTLYGSSVAFLTNPITLFAAAVGVVVFGIKTLLDSQAAELAQQEAEKARILEQIKNDQQEIVDHYKKTLDEQQKAVNVAVQNIQSIYHQLKDVLEREFQAASLTLRNLVDEDVKHRTEAINKIKSEIQRAATEIANLERDKGTGQLRIEDTIFEEKLRELTLASQIQEREIRAQELVADAIRDNERAKTAAANHDIELSSRLEQISKREFEDASKQLDKVAQASLKIKDLSRGFTSSLIDFLKKDFELETKLINDSEKRVMESFKRVKDAVKDIFDKTGDASGESGKFLKDYVKQLTSFLNELKATQGRVRITTRGAVDIDPDLRSVLEAVNPKTIRRLRVAIQIGDQESVKRILGDLETIKKKQDEIAKARLANNAELASQELALAERRNNNFENERKFLKDSLDFAVKSEAEGFKSGIRVRQEMGAIQNRILESYRDESTVKGTIKNREDETFRLIVSQEGVVRKQLGVMKEQLKAQTDLQAVLKQSSDAMEKLRAEREDELETVRTTFQLLEKLKDHNGIVKQEDVDAAKQLVLALQEGAPGLQFHDPQLLEKELRAAQDKANLLQKQFDRQKTQDELEQVRVALDLETDLRFKAAQKLAKQLVAFNEKGPARDELFTRALIDNQDLFAHQEDHRNEIFLLRVRIDQEADKIVERLKKLRKDIEENKVTPEDVIDIQKFTGIDGAVFTQNTKKIFDDLAKQADALGFDLNKRVEFKLDTDAAARNIQTLRKSIEDLKTEFNVEFNVTQKDAVRRNFGGFVDGPNGIDAIHARLSRGEYVVDAQNSSRFANQLRQISSGRTPTTNNSAVNFGGVNINMTPTGDTKVDARQLWTEFKRLQARGVLA